MSTAVATNPAPVVASSRRMAFLAMAAAAVASGDLPSIPPVPGWGPNAHLVCSDCQGRCYSSYAGYRGGAVVPCLSCLGDAPHPGFDLPREPDKPTWARRWHYERDRVREYRPCSACAVLPVPDWVDPASVDLPWQADCSRCGDTGWELVATGPADPYRGEDW